MAKTFYTQEEACKKLDMNPAQLKEAVREGHLREFRDGGNVTYKADQVDKLAAESAEENQIDESIGDIDMLSTAELTLDDSSSASAADASLGFNLAPDEDGDAGASDSLTLAMDDSSADTGTPEMATDDLLLEPLEGDDSGIKLGTAADSDAISLDDTTAEESEEDEKEGTVVTSIGVSVFDDDEVEQEADPLAQTVISDDSGALGIDGVGSGSGLLDLTRESDDTSLGAQLLEEIYPGDEGADTGEATRGGIEEAASDGTDAAAATGFAPPEQATPQMAATTVITRVEFAADPVTTGLTGMLFVAVLVMCLAGLAAAAAVQGVWPSILEKLLAQPLITLGGSAGAAIIAFAIGFFLEKRSGGK